MINHCLISELPLLFNPEVVAGMEDGMLRRLAAESEDVRIERAEERRRLEILKSGLVTCESYDDSRQKSKSSFASLRKDYVIIRVIAELKEST